MSDINLSAMTVIELRKLAKELRVPLGAGISKQGIIEKLTPVVDAKSVPAEPEQPVVQDTPDVQEAPAAQQIPSPQEPSVAPKEDDDEDADASDDAADVPASAAPAERKPETPAQPAFRQAYSAPPRFNSKPAYQAPSYGSRPQYPQRTPGGVEPQRTQTTRPVSGFTPRFGPAAHDPQPAAQEPDTRSFRPAEPAYNAEAPRPAYSADRRPAYQEGPRFGQRPAYDQKPTYDQRASFEQRPSLDQRPAFEQRPNYSAPRRDSGVTPADFNTAAPGLNELLAAGDCPDGSGYLELHPDGYGFLRSDSFLPSAKDIYVSMAQVRRFGLRTGDRVNGKVRPLRDGDKYSAMLYISEVNGQNADTLGNRPSFDELTAVYPRRRLSLETQEPVDVLRAIDLIAPIGYGQRGLLLCPAEYDRKPLLQHLANAAVENAPDAEIFVLLLNENPEDVTDFREEVDCPVLATTFDMPPEQHLRLADLLLEHAQRLAEAKRDVVLIVDSLTTLSKVYTTAAQQQARPTAGTVNPASLNKAKKLFGAARNLREGGSLTVLATMTVDSGNKVDDAVVNEFRTAANMCLTLDAALARSNVEPPIALPFTATRKAELMLTPEENEGMQLLRKSLGELPPARAIPQLLEMLGRLDRNHDLLLRVKDWIREL